MAKSSKLRVMISSRCDDKFPADLSGRPLSEIRKELKMEIEAFEVFGKKIFEVWINEETPPQGGVPGIAGMCAFGRRGLRHLRLALFEWQCGVGEGRR